VSLGKRSIELASAELVKESKQATGGATEMTAVKSELSEKRLGGIARRKQPIAPAVIAGLALVGAEGREVLLVFNLLPHTPGAGVSSDLDFAVEYAYDRLGRDEGEWFFDQGVWDGVVVFIEAQVRRFARRNGFDRVGWEAMLR
jgi:hypothetical protein